MFSNYPPGFSGHLPGEGPWCCTRCGEEHPEREEPDDEGRCEVCAEEVEAEDEEVDGE